MNITYTDQYLKTLLKQRFGFDDFRPGQLDAISLILHHGCVLCIQPTGFGKSLLYQLPAVILEGITLVISPLLALMRDQQTHLNHRFMIPAAAINSDQDEETNDRVRSHAIQGKIRILFVAPEQLDHMDRYQFLLHLPINLLVVDEAHCISAWGHDFRPSYRQIVGFIRDLHKKNNSVKILGLTATADAKTEIDIKSQLSMSNSPMRVVRDSMNRPNIALSVLNTPSLAEKLVACEQLLKQLEGCGLIYCASRENTELVAEYLKNQGVNAAAYHAGFAPEEKVQLQKNFIMDKYKVIAATNALGMGIDKPNLRFVIHFDIPGSITAYYQEVGRSGRDGLKAYGILLFNPADKKIQEHFIESAQPKPDDFDLIMKCVKAALECPTITAIKRLSGLHPTRVAVVVAELVEQGFLVKRSDRGSSQTYACVNSGNQPNLSRYTLQYQVKTRELKNMLEYSQEMGSCRMSLLRLALGDKESQPCNHCDICAQPEAVYQADPDRIAAAASWLDAKPVEIEGYKTNNLSPGFALLSGVMRSPMFVHFMRQRAVSDDVQTALTAELLHLLQFHASLLASKKQIAAIIPIPSRTWKAGGRIASLLGEHWKAPVLPDFLAWKNLPENRQGELLNNDQRHYNVQNRMTIGQRAPLPTGAIILFDDYIGCGATLKEAVRALRKEGRVVQEIIPVAIAAVKWKLGSSGMV